MSHIEDELDLVSYAIHKKLWKLKQLLHYKQELEHELYDQNEHGWNDDDHYYAYANGYDGLGRPPARRGGRVDIEEWIASHASNPNPQYIVFYATFCGHCHELLKKLGFRDNKSRVQPDSESYPDVLFVESEDADISRYGVEGFPTIKKVLGGQIGEDVDRKDLIRYWQGKRYRATS